MAPHCEWPIKTTSRVPTRQAAQSTHPTCQVATMFPATRITNKSPKLKSKTSSAGTRESEQPRMIANGSCPATSASRRALFERVAVSVWPATNRRLPSRRRASASMASIIMERSASFAWRRLPGRVVWNLLEVRARHESCIEVLRVLDHRGHDEPGIAVLLVHAIHVFGHARVGAVGNAIPAQVSRTQVRGDDFQRASARRAAATTSTTAAGGLPAGGGHTLPTRLTSLHGTERERTRLRPGFCLQLEGRVVAPRNAYATRHAHDRRATEWPALFTRGSVPRGIPAVGNLDRRIRQRQARVVALRRRAHAPAPVLGHDRDPHTGEIDGRRRSCRWSAALPSLSPLRREQHGGVRPLHKNALKGSDPVEGYHTQSSDPGSPSHFDRPGAVRGAAAFPPPSETYAASMN